MNLVKIAQNIIEHFLSRQAIDAGMQSLNKHLYDIASSMGIQVVPEGGQSFNFVSSAISAVQAAGAHGSDAEVIALEVIGKLVFREPDQVKQLNKSYVKSSVLPRLVLHFKANGRSLEDVKKEPAIVKIVKDYDVSDKMVQDCYEGKKKVNVPEGAKLGDEWVKTFLKKLQGIPTGRFKSTVRDNIFGEYKSDKGKFSSFWYTAVKNAARDAIEHLKTSDRLLDESLRLVPEDRQKEDYTPGIVHDVAQKDHGTLTKSEAKMMRDKLIRDANKLNPLYGKTLNLIGDDYDLFHDGEHFMKELKLTPKEFAKFKLYFVQDLKKLFHQHHLDNFDDGQAVLKAASKVSMYQKIAEQILRLQES